MRVERTFRGITPELTRTYFESVGGEITGERTAAGPGWQAEFSTETVEVGPSLELTEVTVVFEGDSDGLDEVVDAFEQKAVRSGG